MNVNKTTISQKDTLRKSVMTTMKKKENLITDLERSRSVKVKNAIT
jgi:hypothetical protein